MVLPHKYLWKLNVPAKIRMLFWLLTRRSILTKDNLTRKGWKEAKHCVVCGRDEDINHFFNVLLLD